MRQIKSWGPHALHITESHGRSAAAWFDTAPACLSVDGVLHVLIECPEPERVAKAQVYAVTYGQTPPGA